MTRKLSIKRKTNPVSLSTNAKVARAINLFKRFRGSEPKFIDEYEINIPKVAMLIGKCDGILYTTNREGKTEKYIHEFSGNSCPLLIASWDGSQIFLLGGNYSFTDEGIKDI